jgi:hypothetical protein
MNTQDTEKSLKWKLWIGIKEISILYSYLPMGTASSSGLKGEGVGGRQLLTVKKKSINNMLHRTSDLDTSEQLKINISILVKAWR